MQRQLEALVDRHQVGALVCPVWLRWVAASKVFDEMWSRKVLAEDEADRRPNCSAADGGAALVYVSSP
jgi:hypothetical protein